MKNLRLAALAGLAALLAACASKPALGPAVVPTATVSASNFSDAKPHDWGGRAPKTYPVHGVDIARFQTSVDWQTARANGVNFAFIKATEGGDRVDPMFADHWRGAGQAGVARGAYHFYYFCRPAAEQAAWYIRNVPRSTGALPPVLDMEWNPFSPTCTLRPAPEVVRREAAIFMNILAEHYGQAPILYTTIDFYEQNQMWRLSGNDFWLRSVAAHPDDRYDGQEWTFWQYTGTGVAPGIAGRVDINVFNGGAGAWANWLARRVQ